MSSLLASLREHAAPLTPEGFLAHHPGAWVQYYDDTPAKDPTKALSAPAFDRATAQAKQADSCAVCFSLQAFDGARTADRLIRVQNLGVDVDLGEAADGTPADEETVEAAKEYYLRDFLPRFPLRPHWIVETRHGLHLVFRLRPVTDAQEVRDALALGRRLVTALRGDENAILPTQLLRVPNTYQFKEPDRPFLCRLLVDNAAAMPPHDLAAVEAAVRAMEGIRPAAAEPPQPPSADPPRSWQRWRKGLAGVTRGERNATAASLAGGLIGRLPNELWDIGGWGGLKEWNARNAEPLADHELRSVFDSIARRERNRRGRLAPPSAR